MLEAKAQKYLGQRKICICSAIRENDLLAIKILVLLKKVEGDINFAIVEGKQDAALLMIDLRCENTSPQRFSFITNVICWDLKEITIALINADYPFYNAEVISVCRKEKRFRDKRNPFHGWMLSNF